MNRPLQASSSERLFEELAPAGKGQTGGVLKTDLLEDAAMAGEPEEPVGKSADQAELAKLRAFFLEKLTVKQLRHLLSTLDEPHGDSPMVKIVKEPMEFKQPVRRMKRREKVNKAVSHPGNYRASMVPKDFRYALSFLSISNFTIETPVAASRNINCIKICGGTSRLLYDTNFMLGEDWCSCVISVHFNQIEWISCTGLDLILDLNQPAIVEAGYRNGSSVTLGVPNVEIENGLRHHLIMKSTNDMVGFKAALMSIEPSTVHKFVAAKFNRDPDMPPMHNQLDQRPVDPSDIPAPYRPQMNHAMMVSNGTSQYMVPQLCPNSYGQIDSNNPFTQNDNPFTQNPGYAPSMDLNLFTHGPPTFKYPTGSGADDRKNCAKLEPIDTHGGVDPVQSMYTQESLFRESQYANIHRTPSPAANSEYYVQAMQSNSDYYVDSSTTTFPQDHHNGACPPRKSILELALLGVGETSLLDHGSREEGHQWGAGASHLGYFDNPS